MAIGLFNCFHSRPILKISQGNGLRDPECGRTFEPFSFLSVGGLCQGKLGQVASHVAVGVIEITGEGLLLKEYCPGGLMGLVLSEARAEIPRLSL